MVTAASSAAPGREIRPSGNNGTPSGGRRIWTRRLAGDGKPAVIYVRDKRHPNRPEPGATPSYHVGNRTIPDMINFWPPGASIAARRVLENALRSLGCSASTGRPFLIQPPPWGPVPVPEGELGRCPGQAPGGRMGNLPRAQ